MATEVAQAPVAATLESHHAPPTELLPPPASDPAASPADEVPHAARAWEFFRSMGSPKFHVAPMVDQSELPFRMLCRKYGATCAYTPMIHSRLFVDDVKYRQEVWSTCQEDRPLLAQFCANDPDYLVKAAAIVAPHADAIDINFGCPQRIAKRGNYGSFLMDNLPLVERLVKTLAENSSVPVTCKIRVFPKLEDTLAYARMIERAGCCLLAVHGRTREQKDNTHTRADWDQIKAVKQAMRIPVLANGNIRNLHDAVRCMEYTGADGVLSAESLLDDPALFDPCRLTPQGAYTQLQRIDLTLDYLALVEAHPTHMRMVKGHVHKILAPWLAEYVDLREAVGKCHHSVKAMIEIIKDLQGRVKASGRDHPIPVITPRQAERMAKAAARKAAIDEQQREEEALKGIGVVVGTCDNAQQSQGQGQASQPSASAVQGAEQAFAVAAGAAAAQQPQGQAGASVDGTLPEGAQQQAGGQQQQEQEGKGVKRAAEAEAEDPRGSATTVARVEECESCY